MLPRIHFLAGIFFITLIYLIFPEISKIGLVIILLSSVLIDSDHMIYYFLRTKNLNLKKALQWYKTNLCKTLSLNLTERKKRYTGFYILHGIEMLLILFLLGIFVYPLFMFVFLGFFFHMLLDIPSEILTKGTFHKFSLIYSYIQFKKFKKTNNLSLSTI